MPAVFRGQSKWLISGEPFAIKVIYLNNGQDEAPASLTHTDWVRGPRTDGMHYLYQPTFFRERIQSSSEPSPVVWGSIPAACGSYRLFAGIQMFSQVVRVCILSSSRKAHHQRWEPIEMQQKMRTDFSAEFVHWRKQTPVTKCNTDSTLGALTAWPDGRRHYLYTI